MPRNYDENKVLEMLSYKKKGLNNLEIARLMKCDGRQVRRWISYGKRSGVGQLSPTIKK